jgi:hypothetical protein
MLEPAFHAELAAILPPASLLTAAEDTQPYECDGRSLYRERPGAVALPLNESQVAAVLLRCFEARIPVVPRGAGTGQSGGTAGADIDATKAWNLTTGRGYAITAPRWFEPAALIPPGPHPDFARPPLLPVLGAPAGPDPDAVRDLFAFGFVTAPRSFFPIASISATVLSPR